MVIAKQAAKQIILRPNLRRIAMMEMEMIVTIMVKMINNEYD